MPLDPSIISSYNPGAGIDVNALMQQRMQGMENINALERQRQADALDMQDRAAAQKKAQEAATIKALLPAYTYGIQTGDIEGALNLAPPDMRDGLMPYAEALRGKSPEQVRVALYGSLAGSPEGQEALAAIQRAETAGIQREQNVLTREDINLRRQKQALDARGEGAWELKEGEGGFFWTNPRTRQVIPADVTGGAAPAVAARGAVPGPTPIPAPDVVTPRMPETGVPAAEAPISTAQPPDQQPKFRPKPKSEKVSESERTAAFNAGRTLLAAADIFSSVKSDPSAVAPGPLEAAVGLFMDPNFVRSEDRQVINSAQYEAIDAILTLATGAAYNQEQRESQIQRFVPLYSDKAKNREAKKQALLKYIEMAKVKSGYAWTPEMDAALQQLNLVGGADETPTTAPAAAADTGGFKIRSVREQ